MQECYFDGLDLYKNEKLQGYIEETNDPQDKYIFWLCPYHVKGVDEMDLHYYEGTLDATKQAILDDYETENN